MLIDVMAHYRLARSIDQGKNTLFYDLAQDKQRQIPKQNERERQALVKIVSIRRHGLLMRRMS